MIKLISSNYYIWKPRMEDILYCKDLYEPWQNEGKKPYAMSDSILTLMNRKTLLLLSSLLENGRLRIRSDVKCYYCHKKGHMKRECRKLKREQRENGDASNVATTIFHGNEVIFVCDNTLVNLTS
uniref:CCHC-type domain-containing protein n=1 Tax=Cajanus cajan TaxID=3821 RepID=A0A151RPU1_CAJCA|nr:hypothetical protein KK1_033907 [Cajanus cajan]